MIKLTFARFDKTVSFDVPTFKETANGEAYLPEASAEYIFHYGWKQSLSDSFASAKTAAEFESQLGKRWEAIQSGKVGIRTRGPADPFEAECLAISRKIVAARIKAKNLKVEKEQLIALVLKYREEHAEEVETEAQANLDKLAAASAGLDDLFDSVLGKTEIEATDETVTE